VPFEAGRHGQGAQSSRGSGELARGCLDFLLLHDAFNHLYVALDAIQRNSARCCREETENPESTAWEIVRGPSRLDNLANFEPVLGHGDPPSEPKDGDIIPAVCRLGECCHEWTWLFRRGLLARSSLGAIDFTSGPRGA
jgi:hypothetical protein